MMVSQYEILDRLTRHCLFDLRHGLHGIAVLKNLFRSFEHENVIVEGHEHDVMRASRQSIQHVNIFSDLRDGWWRRICRPSFEFLESFRSCKYALRWFRVDLNLGVLRFLNDSTRVVQNTRAGQLQLSDRAIV